jgi:hypothetical protein
MRKLSSYQVANVLLQHSALLGFEMRRQPREHHGAPKLHGQRGKVTKVSVLTPSLIILFMIYNLRLY